MADESITCPSPLLEVSLLCVHVPCLPRAVTAAGLPSGWALGSVLVGRRLLASACWQQRQSSQSWGEAVALVVVLGRPSLATAMQGECKAGIFCLFLVQARGKSDQQGVGSYLALRIPSGPDGPVLRRACLAFLFYIPLYVDHRLA